MLLNSIDIPTYGTIPKELKRKFPSVFVKYYISTWLENWKDKVIQYKFG